MVLGSSRFPSTTCWIQRVQEPGSGPDRIVQLTAHQAEWLCSHLDRILQELTERDDTNETDRQTYAVMVAAVPLPD
jgi:hypothetical protein